MGQPRRVRDSASSSRMLIRTASSPHNTVASAIQSMIKIKFAWPEMCYRTVRGGLVVSPSPPRIAATHLRLIE